MEWLTSRAHFCSLASRKEQPGKVFKSWREEYVCITWKELVEFYEQHKLGHKFIDERGGFRIPDDWEWGRAQDRGYTEGHPCITAYMARPRANYPLSDSVFVFSELIAPTGAEVGEIVPLLRARERELGLTGRTPQLSLYSHEGAEERRVYLKDHGLRWEAWSTDYNVGIPQINEWLMLVDTTKPNPIRPVLDGRTRIYFVCADDEARLEFNPSAGRYFVTAAQTERGFKRARAEMVSYHYPPEELGKPLAKMRPVKIFDDFIDPLRAFATRWGPSVAPLTRQERIERALPSPLKAETIAQLPAEDKSNAIMTRQIEVERLMAKEQRSKYYSPLLRARAERRAKNPY